MTSFKKPVRQTEKKFLQFIHEWPCAIPHCGNPWPVHAHHTKTRGAGGSDLTCIPLCPNHHTMIHNLGLKTFQHKYAFDLPEAVSRYNQLYNDGASGPYEPQVNWLKNQGKIFKAT